MRGTHPWLSWWKGRSRAWWVGAVAGLLFAIIAATALELAFDITFYGGGLGFLGAFGGGWIGERIALRLRHRRTLIWTAVFLAWGLVLLVSNGPHVPDASAVRYEDVYADLSPADQVEIYPEHQYVPAESRTRSGFPHSRFLPPPDPHSAAVSVREGLPEQEVQTVTAHFKMVLQRRVTRERMLFALRGVVWWAAEATMFLAFGWLVVTIRRAGLEKWHPGQLVLVWLGAATWEFAVWTAGDGDVAGLFTFLLQIPKPAGSSLPGLVLGLPLVLLLVVLSIGIPCVMFGFTWIWFGSRNSQT